MAQLTYKYSPLDPATNKLTIHDTANDCLLKTESTDPIFQRTDNDSPEVTVPEKR